MPFEKKWLILHSGEDEKVFGGVLKVCTATVPESKIKFWTNVTCFYWEIEKIEIK